MNSILLGFFQRNAVLKLPDRKREIYQFIEGKENQLEEVATNEEHFIRLLCERSPFKAAADHFSLDISYIKDLMDEAQEEIDRVIDERCNRMKWIDCTDMMRYAEGKDNQWAFIFVS